MVEKIPSINMILFLVEIKEPRPWKDIKFPFVPQTVLHVFSRRPFMGLEWNDTPQHEKSWDPSVNDNAFADDE